MKTMIAVPCMDTLPVEFVQSILYMEKGENIHVVFKQNSLVYDSRNLISLHAIENDFDRVLWLDSDMAFQRDTLMRLHKDMDTYGCEMVSGLYVKRSFPTMPVIYRTIDKPTRKADGRLTKNIVSYNDYPWESVFKIGGCGFGCVLTSVKLLKEVWDEYGPAFAPYPWCGEDLSFCYRVNQLGHTIMCDSNVKCGHIGKYVYQEQDLYREVMGIGKGDGDENADNDADTSSQADG